MLKARRRREPRRTRAQIGAEGANIRSCDLCRARKLAERLPSVGVLRLAIEHEHDRSENRKKKQEERERRVPNRAATASVSRETWIDHGAPAQGIGSGGDMRAPPKE
jgi:hypothetical protein